MVDVGNCIMGEKKVVEETVIGELKMVKHCWDLKTSVVLEWQVTQRVQGMFEGLDGNQTVEMIGMLDDYFLRAEVMV